MRNTFPKSERLKSRKLIDILFSEGKSEFQYPLKLFYKKHKKTTQRPKILTGVTVPKRNFKKAVDRNRIKRQMRELYRLNKEVFYKLVDEDGGVMDCMLVYIAKEHLPYQKMEAAILEILKRVN